MVQSICDELVEVWGERGSVRGCQWDLVGPRQGKEGEKAARLGGQHFQYGLHSNKRPIGARRTRRKWSKIRSLGTRKLEYSHARSSIYKCGQTLGRQPVWPWSTLENDARKLCPNRQSQGVMILLSGIVLERTLRVGPQRDRQAGAVFSVRLVQKYN